MIKPSPRQGARNARWLLAAVLGVLVGGAALTTRLVARYRRIFERIALGA
jgi:hypothetical protein